MPHVQLGWQAAFEITAALGAVAGLVLLVSLRVRRLVVLAQAALQSAVMVALFGLWQLIGAHTTQQTVGADERGRAIWDTERAWHVPSEAWLQSFVLPHADVTQAANAYYVYGHFNPLMLLLAWVWLRHRDAYLRVCVVLVVFTTAATLVQLFAVAPPRLLPGHLVVDTPEVYGQSVYGPAGLGGASHLSAMPSIHVGWSVLAGLFVVTLSRRRWRWLALLHPLTMVVVVVVTGNHYWADGVVSMILLGAAYTLVSTAMRGVGDRDERDAAEPGGPGGPGGPAGRWRARPPVPARTLDF